MKTTKAIYNTMREREAYDKAISEYNDKSWFYRLLHKAPVPNDERTAKELAEAYIAQWNSEHKTTMETPEGEYASVYMKYCSNTYYPVVIFRAYISGCFFISRSLVKEDSIEEWGCPYPESECGLTADEEALANYPKFLNAYRDYMGMVHEVNREL